jgi:L-iditol 2-dehydrogenase/D-xylulose reductase
MGAQSSVPVPLFHIISRELQILGSFRYGPGAYQLAISLVERGLVDVKPLITQRYAFLDSGAAFEATKLGRDVDGKVDLTASRLTSALTWQTVIKCIIDGPLAE